MSIESYNEERMEHIEEILNHLPEATDPVAEVLLENGRRLVRRGTDLQEDWNELEDRATDLARRWNDIAERANHLASELEGRVERIKDIASELEVINDPNLTREAEGRLEEARALLGCAEEYVSLAKCFMGDSDEFMRDATDRMGEAVSYITEVEGLISIRSG